VRYRTHIVYFAFREIHLGYKLFQTAIPSRPTQDLISFQPHTASPRSPQAKLWNAGHDKQLFRYHTHVRVCTARTSCTQPPRLSTSPNLTRKGRGFPPEREGRVADHLTIVHHTQSSLLARTGHWEVFAPVSYHLSNIWGPITLVGSNRSRKLFLEFLGAPTPLPKVRQPVAGTTSCMSFTPLHPGVFFLVQQESLLCVLDAYRRI